MPLGLFPRRRMPDTATASPLSDDKGAAPDPRAPYGILPRDPRTLMLAAILILLIFYTLYFAAQVIIPLIFALLLKLLLQPGQRLLTRLRLPKSVAAIILIAAFFGIIGGLGFGLSGPASTWLAKAPESMARLEHRLTALRRPVDRFLNVTHEVEQMTEAPADKGAPAVTVRTASLGQYLFSSTRSFVAGIGVTVVLLYFLLAAGDIFLRRLVEILPSFHDKKQAVEISYQIEENISAYLLTITVMNVLVGLATGIAMYAIGLPDPALWGTLAFILNYVLILGPLTALGILVAVGVLTYDPLWQALLPAGAYLVIHTVEGQIVTPMLVARRFTLNPVLVIGSLIFWNWLWGIPGALLAVPMLAVFKILCERVRPLMPIGHFIGG